MALTDWEMNLALEAIGITDEGQQQTVKNAIPVAAKMVDHINENKQLFATLFADFQLVMPAVKIILDAMAAKGYTAQSLTKLEDGG